MGAVQKGTKQGWGPQMTLDRGALKVFVESKRQSMNMGSEITRYNLTPQTTKTLISSPNSSLPTMVL